MYTKMYTGAVHRRRRECHRLSRDINDANDKDIDRGVIPAAHQAPAHRVVKKGERPAGQATSKIFEMKGSTEDMFPADLNGADAVTNVGARSKNRSTSIDDSFLLNKMIRKPQPHEENRLKQDITNGTASFDTRRSRDSENFNAPRAKLPTREDVRKEVNMAMFEKLPRLRGNKTQKKTRRVSMIHNNISMQRSSPPIERQKAAHDTRNAKGPEYHPTNKNSHDLTQARSTATTSQSLAIVRGNAFINSQNSRKRENSKQTQSNPRSDGNLVEWSPPRDGRVFSTFDHNSANIGPLSKGVHIFDKKVGNNIEAQTFQQLLDPSANMMDRRKMTENRPHDEVDIHKMAQLLNGHNVSSKGHSDDFPPHDNERKLTGVKENQVSTRESAQNQGEYTTTRAATGSRRQHSHNKLLPNHEKNDRSLTRKPAKLSKRDPLMDPRDERLSDGTGIDSWLEHSRDSVALAKCAKLRERRQEGSHDRISREEKYHMYDPCKDEEFMREYEQEMKYVRPAPPQEIGDIRDEKVQPRQEINSIGKVRVENSPQDIILRVLREMLIVKGGKVNFPYCSVPKDILDVINILPGNNKCCDCGTFEGDGKPLIWASVSYGTLLCKNCAFRHITKSDDVSRFQNSNSSEMFIALLNFVSSFAQLPICYHHRKSIATETLP